MTWFHRLCFILSVIQMFLIILQIVHTLSSPVRIIATVQYLVYDVLEVSQQSIYSIYSRLIAVLLAILMKGIAIPLVSANVKPKSRVIIIARVTRMYRFLACVVCVCPGAKN